MIQTWQKGGPLASFTSALHTFEITVSASTTATPQRWGQLGKPDKRKCSSHWPVLWVDCEVVNTCGTGVLNNRQSLDKLAFMEEKLVKCNIKAPASRPSSPRLPRVESLRTSGMEGHRRGCAVRAGVREVSPVSHSQVDMDEDCFGGGCALILSQDAAGGLWDFRSTYFCLLTAFRMYT